MIRIRGLGGRLQVPGELQGRLQDPRRPGAHPQRRRGTRGPLLSGFLRQPRTRSDFKGRVRGRARPVVWLGFGGLPHLGGPRSLFVGVNCHKRCSICACVFFFSGVTCFALCQATGRGPCFSKSRHEHSRSSREDLKKGRVAMETSGWVPKWRGFRPQNQLRCSFGSSNHWNHTHNPNCSRIYRTWAGIQDRATALVSKLKPKLKRASRYTHSHT